MVINISSLKILPTLIVRCTSLCVPGNDQPFYHRARVFFIKAHKVIKPTYEHIVGLDYYFTDENEVSRTIRTKLYAACG